MSDVSADGLPGDLEAQIEAFIDGKIRYAGCSNYTGWQIMKSIMVSERCNFQWFVTQQIHDTLEAREVEYKLLPPSIDQGVGLTGTVRGKLVEAGRVSN